MSEVNAELLYIVFMYTAVMVLFAAILVGYFRKISSNQTMSDEEKIAVTKRLLSNLAPLAWQFIVDAEERYSHQPGSGKIKLSMVVAELYKLVPNEAKSWVTYENLEVIAEQALLEVREYWKAQQ